MCSPEIYLHRIARLIIQIWYNITISLFSDFYWRSNGLFAYIFLNQNASKIFQQLPFQVFSASKTEPSDFLRAGRLWMRSSEIVQKEANFIVKARLNQIEQDPKETLNVHLSLCIFK